MDQFILIFLSAVCFECQLMQMICLSVVNWFFSQVLISAVLSISPFQLFVLNTGKFQLFIFKH